MELVWILKRCSEALSCEGQERVVGVGEEAHGTDDGEVFGTVGSQLIEAEGCDVGSFWSVRYA